MSWSCARDRGTWCVGVRLYLRVGSGIVACERSSRRSVVDRLDAEPLEPLEAVARGQQHLGCMRLPPLDLADHPQRLSRAVRPRRIARELRAAPVQGFIASQSPGLTYMILRARGDSNAQPSDP